MRVGRRRGCETEPRARVAGAAIYLALLAVGAGTWPVVVASEIRGDGHIDRALRGGTVLAALIGAGLAHLYLRRCEPQLRGRLLESPIEGVLDDGWIVAFAALSATVLAYFVGVVGTVLLGVGIVELDRYL